MHQAICVERLTIQLLTAYIVVADDQACRCVGRLRAFQVKM